MFADAIICLLNLFLACKMIVKRKGKGGREKREEEKKRKRKKKKTPKQKGRFGLSKFRCSDDMEVTERVFWWLVGAEC